MTEPRMLMQRRVCNRLIAATLFGVVGFRATRRAQGRRRNCGNPTSSRNYRAPFSISLVPAVPVPIRIGTNLGFNVSSSYRRLLQSLSDRSGR